VTSFRQSSCVMCRLSIFSLKHLLLWNRHWPLLKNYRNDLWVVPCYHIFFSNGSDWLHKLMGVTNGVPKCLFQNSCLKRQGPELPYLVYMYMYNIIVLYQSCLKYTLGMKDDPALGVTMLHSIVFINRLVQLNKTSGQILLGDPLAKVLKWGQKIGFRRFPKCIC